MRSTPPLHEITYAAALFDGEGCCQVKTRTGYPCIVISMTDLEPLERVQQWFGGHIRVEGGTRKPCYRLKMYGVIHTRWFTNLVWSHICQRRKDQIARALGRRAYGPQTTRMDSVFGRSAVRRRLVVEFCLIPGLRLHVRDAARRVGAAAGHVGRELQYLEGEGVLEAHKEGQRRVYAWAASEAAAAVRSLVNGKLGLEQQLAAAVKDVDGIEQAFIFGSRARGAEGEGSDIDVLIVGEHFNRALLFGRLTDIERVIGREINVVRVASSEWVANETGFVRDVRSKPLVSLTASAPSLRHRPCGTSKP